MLGAKPVLDHPLEAEAIVVFRFTKDLPFWLILPLRDSKVALSYGHVTGCETLMRTTDKALRMMEVLESGS